MFRVYFSISYISFALLYFIQSILFSDDLAGKILAWLSLSPIFILIGFVAVIIFRRELHTVQSSVK
jgi:hypothetical protein